MDANQYNRLVELMEDILAAIKANGMTGGAKITPTTKPKEYTGWRAVEVPPFIKKYAGQRLGDMAAKDVKWWAENYQPRPYKGEIQQRDIDLKEALVEGASDPSLNATAPAPQYTPKPKAAPPTEAQMANQGGELNEDVPF